MEGTIEEVGSLDWLINPVPTKRYFEAYWERQPLVVKRDQAAYFCSLLSLSDVDRVITTLDRRYPDICLKNADLDVNDAEYASPSGVIDVAKLYQLFEQGATIVIAFLDTVVPSLTQFCRKLEREFSCPFQTNVYLTPPGAQGAAGHYDTHDVFVLQIAGSKKWTMFETPVELPLSGQTYDARIHKLGSPTMEFELNAGDVAYIPRGVGHLARSTDSVSLHITAGILRYTWADLLLELVSVASLNSAELRKALPPGFAQSEFDREQARETLDSLLGQALTRSHFETAFETFVDKFVAACPPLLDGQMAQLLGLEHLNSDSVVGARPGVISLLQVSGDSVFLDCYGRTMKFPPQACDAVQFALKHRRFAVRDLPGNLDDAGKLIIVRRLIREGVLMAFEPRSLNAS